MDIATLPAPLLAPAGLAVAGRARDVVAPAPASTKWPAAGPDLPPVERIVQGEWLGREATDVTPAGHYLRGRVSELFNPQIAAYPLHPAPARAGERAVNAYLGNTRDSLRHAITRGRSVDYFV